MPDAPAEQAERRRARIRWRARRGTRELDVFLARFLDARLAELDAAALDAVERLLEVQDPELQAWLTGSARPDDPSLTALVDEIRGYADHR